MKKHLIFSVFGLLALAAAASAQSYAFNTDLYLGSQGSDVANLQTFLIANGFNIPSITSGATPKGYFGNQTQAALAAFQQSVGITSNGFFGPITRNWINTHGSAPSGVIIPPSSPIISPAQPVSPTYPAYPSYPSYPTYPTYPSNQQASPVISGVTGPTSLSINQTGTWTVNASDPQNGYLSYAVDWGDSSSCPLGLTCSASTLASQNFVQQTSFTHSFATAGLYTIRFTVRNAAGFTAQTNTVVQVTNTIAGGAGPLQIVSPNGGEVWQLGTVHSITWTSPYYFAATNVDLKIIQTFNCTTQICPAIAYAPITIATNIPANQNSYTWNVGQSVNVCTNSTYSANISCGVSQPTIPAGQYTMQICQSGTSICDSSNNTFTITSSGINNNPGQIIVTSPNGGEIWQANTTRQITWNYSNGGYYNYAVDIYLTSGQMTYTLDRNISSNTVYNWIVGTDINNNTIPAGNYFVEICPTGNTTNCDTSNSSFTITGTAYPYYPTTSGAYYTPPVYGTTYPSGYSSTTQCPAGYICTPTTNTGATYSY